MGNHFCVYWILFLNCVYVIYGAKMKSSEKSVILFDLSNTGSKDIYKNNITIEENAVSFVITNLNPSSHFFIIQIHTYIESITLSYSKKLMLHNNVNGTSVGLYWGRNIINKPMTFYLLRNNLIEQKLNLMAYISTYEISDPVPGGCSLSFETEYAPYQKIKYNDGTITVTAQPPSKYASDICNETNITTQMYYMHLDENDHTEENYFEAIEKMLFLEKIVEFGTKVPVNLGFTQYKQLYNFYKGKGKAFAVVSTLNNRSSIYVPILSFGCNIAKWDDECLEPDGAVSRLIYAMLLILGLFVCFEGHRYFKTGLFLVGYTVGAILVSILCAIRDVCFDSDGNVVFGLVLGLLFGGCLVFLYRWLGIPILTTLCVFFLCGFIIASIFYYGTLDQLTYSNDRIFWLYFGFIMLASIGALSVKLHYGNIIALSLLGSYATTAALCIYFGGTLHYIFINIFRRITIEGFNMAIVDPPYKLIDISQTILWITLFTAGVHVQIANSRGKPPFPPHINGGNVTVPPGETTSLINPHTVIIRNYV